MCDEPDLLVPRLGNFMLACARVHQMFRVSQYSSKHGYDLRAGEHGSEMSSHIEDLFE